jgi:hypothetical protein
MLEVTGRQGKRSKQLLNKLEEKREYWKLKDEALDRTVCRTRSLGGVVLLTCRKTDCGMMLFQVTKLYRAERTEKDFHEDERVL